LHAFRLDLDFKHEEMLRIIIPTSTRRVIVSARKNWVLGLSLFCLSQMVSAQDMGLTQQFSACMDTSNGVTSRMLDCIDAETKRQDTRLNKAYKVVMDDLSPDRKKQLQTAQRAWLSYRDTNCQFYADPEGGSLARVNGNSCFMSATASRSAELEALSGHSAPTPDQPTPLARSATPSPSAPNTSNTLQNLTGPQKNAVRAAKSYLNISAFSRDGLIEQLSSSAGSGFNRTDATLAVDSMNVDWNQEAVKSAKQYLQLMGFSCKGLVQQLSSPAGGKFTEKQAVFGAQQAGAC